ncbi:MAG TPA: methylmalonyl Co-A mutase-associated GTPase MeaB [Bacteroidia bacterium]|nr:methylmalonyl Co-A mutase-associated GTPase MeaB [Bacteroidia bacterium]HRS57595.1 methylmalonyl Co-A mutase-associated GTPase MeaB [Bacteroidia bacterium]HRU67181.1 methylmalonyl Co-A mutase-associated GTPase MeaB [Bacteroidia bacterium]
MMDKKEEKLKIIEGVEQPSSINTRILRGIKKSTGRLLTAEEYFQGIKSGNRTLLAKAITLIESNRPEHQEIASQIIERCLPLSGKSKRIGVTGVPGVGKSTFIESLGSSLVDQGMKVAVLAVDPSSNRSKGSILGDKTRMPVLSAHPNAFVRPSPSSGTLGGVARKSRETMIACEAAGYEVIFIETVGVGQSETTVHSMVDMFLLLMLPGAGDELQGIKRGIMELADMIILNKVDESSEIIINRAKTDYTNALHLLPPSDSGWIPLVCQCSSVTGKGIELVWEKISEYFSFITGNGYFDKNREQQASFWFLETLNDEIKKMLYSSPEMKKIIQEYHKKVSVNKISPFEAAQTVLKFFREKIYHE